MLDFIEPVSRHSRVHEWDIDIFIATTVHSFAGKGVVSAEEKNANESVKVVNIELEVRVVLLTGIPNSLAYNHVHQVLVEVQLEDFIGIHVHKLWMSLSEVIG